MPTHFPHNARLPGDTPGPSLHRRATQGWWWWSAGVGLVLILVVLVTLILLL